MLGCSIGIPSAQNWQFLHKFLFFVHLKGDLNIYGFLKKRKKKKSWQACATVLSSVWLASCPPALRSSHITESYELKKLLLLKKNNLLSHPANKEQCDCSFGVGFLARYGGG